MTVRQRTAQRKAEAAALAVADARWAQLQARSGDFFYGVSSTGIFCRPSCGARLPKPEHVRFFEHAVTAQAAGFRPCLRCRPAAPFAGTPSDDSDRVALVERLVRAILADPQQARLARLAELAGLSPTYVQRVFKASTGLSPRELAARVRAGNAAQALAEGHSVTRALVDSGHSSSSRFYEQTAPRLGATPALLRRGGEGSVLWYDVLPCSLGQLLLAASERGVCAVFFGDDAQALVAELRARFPRAQLTAVSPAGPAHPRWTDWESLVVRMLEEPAVARELPLDLRGTLFQVRVWDALRQVPVGERQSYGALAASLSSSARAVARACAANPVAVAVPCHRIVAADGALTGYRWGLDRKAELLRRERGPQDKPPPR